MVRGIIRVSTENLTAVVQPVIVTFLFDIS